MAKYQTKEIKDKEIWEDFVLSKNPKSFLQSWNWGETNKLIGDKVIRVGFFQKEKLVGVCQLIKQKARRGPHLLIPGGPVIGWEDKSLVRFFLKEIKRIGENEKAWFIRIRPELLNNKENKKLFKRLGLISSPMHLHAENTWVLDLDRSEDDILMGMRKNTRYYVRKSLKNDFELGLSIDPKDAQIIFDLQKVTVERHDFVGFPKKLFEAQIQTFAQDNQGSLFLIKKDGRIDVAAIVIFYGDYAFYHQSASGEKARDNYASYYLQWMIIKEAKKRGIKKYDMWGAVPKGVEDHRFKGPSLFKKGFGPERVDWLHAHDLPLSKLYWATYLFETGRRIARGL